MYAIAFRVGLLLLNKPVVCFFFSIVLLIPAFCLTLLLYLSLLCLHRFSHSFTIYAFALNNI